LEENQIINKQYNAYKNDVRKGVIWAALGVAINSMGEIIPIIGDLFSIIGFIMEFIGIKKLSDNAQNDKGILKNFILSVIFVVLALFTPMTIIGFLVPDPEILLFTYVGDIDFMKVLNDIFHMGIGIFSIVATVFIVFGVFAIVTTYKYLKSISVEYNVPLMKYVAIGYIVGFFLIPLFGIGLLILFVTSIVKIYAYLQIGKK